MTRQILGLSLLVLSCFWSCSKAEPDKVQTAPSQTQQAASTATPGISEAKEAVARVFKDAAWIDENQVPNFLTGDFNGDNSADLAVFLKPAPGKLAEINQQFPPWILKDPFVIPRPGGALLQISNQEQLLAVIHGYGAKGWRDPQATQTYLLKNSVGLNVKAQTRNEVLSAVQGNPAPKLSGDLISETLRGKSGYLYYNGAQYSWYDPKTFRGEVETRLTHPGMSPRRSKFDLLHPKFVPAER